MFVTTMFVTTTTKNKQNTARYITHYIIHIYRNLSSLYLQIPKYTTCTYSIHNSSYIICIWVWIPAVPKFKIQFKLLVFHIHDLNRGKYGHHAKTKQRFMDPLYLDTHFNGLELEAFLLPRLEWSCSSF